jgi:tetratricopeptide (TPR) repeat protein
VSNEGRERENGYRAFISYSHRDDAAAKSLHKRLETYRLPKKLIGQIGERGPIPERLTPIFRDLDELSAADDLTVEIKAALARSATLIILCSPGAKASKWVNLEIETFRALHGNTRPVLAALIEGEPADAFPPALTADGHEPVAADFRKSRDGKSLALLKLVAGMAGAPLDALVQRDAQRQLRRVTAITVSALTAVVAMALLLAVALRAQSEAERQRQEAEGLVEYMLTDLRDKLKGVGRLDVMTAVNERAMKYYGGESIKGRLLKARVLHAMGEDDERRGNLHLAEQKFEEARSTTSAILTKAPRNREAILAHAQSEFWIGYANQIRGNYQKSIVSYQNQITLLEKLESKYVDYQWTKLKSSGYNAIGTIYFNNFKNYEQALYYFLKYRDSVLHRQSTEANNKASRYELSDAYAWVADAYLALGRANQAKAERLKQAAALDELLRRDPANQQYLWARIGADRAIFRLCYRAKRDQCALDSIISAERRLISTPHDVDDASWTWMDFYVRLDQGFMALRSNDCRRANYFNGLTRDLFELYDKKSSKNPTDINDMKISLDSLNILIFDKCKTEREL